MLVKNWMMIIDEQLLWHINYELCENELINLGQMI
jgi:hypothetical protein